MAALRSSPPRSIRLTETSVVLKDGSELPADLVVYATGYGSMNQWAGGALISPEVADQGRQVLGRGVSGTAKDPGPWGRASLRNMWKPTAQGGAVVPWRQSRPVAALFRVTWRCSSRPGWKACRRRSTVAPPVAITPLPDEGFDEVRRLLGRRLPCCWAGLHVLSPVSGAGSHVDLGATLKRRPRGAAQREHRRRLAAGAIFVRDRGS